MKKAIHQGSLVVHGGAGYDRPWNSPALMKKTISPRWFRRPRRGGLRPPVEFARLNEEDNFTEVVSSFMEGRATTASTVQPA